MSKSIERKIEAIDYVLGNLTSWLNQVASSAYFVQQGQSKNARAVEEKFHQWIMENRSVLPDDVVNSVARLSSRITGWIMSSGSSDTPNSMINSHENSFSEVRRVLSSYKNELLAELDKEEAADREKATKEMVKGISNNPPQIKELVMGNKYHFGDVTGSIINIDSTLEQVTQTIGSANIEDSAKKQITELIEQLKTELQKVSLDNKEEAEALADTAKALLDASTKASPNKATVKITAEGLMKAAENLASAMPKVLSIASGIVKTIFQLVGISLP